MSVFIDIPKKLSEWIGVPGLIAVLTPFKDDCRSDITLQKPR